VFVTSCTAMREYQFDELCGYDKLLCVCVCVRACVGARARVCVCMCFIEFR